MVDGRQEPTPAEACQCALYLRTCLFVCLLTLCVFVCVTRLLTGEEIPLFDACFSFSFFYY